MMTFKNEAVRLAYGGVAPTAFSRLNQKWGSGEAAMHVVLPLLGGFKGVAVGRREVRPLPLP